MSTNQRLLAERVTATGGAEMVNGRPAQSVTVNLAESPLGWLFARGLVTQRQFDAGERLRADWERSELSPRVTMTWDAAPISRGRGGASSRPDLNGAQIDARRRFDGAVEAAGPGLADIYGAWSALAMECGRRSPRSDGQPAPANWY